VSRISQLLLSVLCASAASPAVHADVPSPDLPEQFDLTARVLRLDLDGESATAEDARLQAGGIDVAAATLEWSDGGRRLRLLEARLRLDLPDLGTLGAAAEEIVVEGGEAAVREGSLSRCPLEQAGWRINFASACADADGDVTVRNATLRLFDVPVLWAPWAMLRFGRVPGLLPPAIGSREGRGPFARLAASLPAGDGGEFGVAVTGFPMDDVDIAGSWLAENGRVDLGATGLAFEPRAFLRTEVAAPLPAGGAAISRGVWAQAGFEPAGSVDAIDPQAAALRLPSVRADRFVVFGGESWSVATGATTWQAAPDGALEHGFAALPRLRVGWSPGLLGDSVRVPGAFRLGVWRPLDGLTIAEDHTGHELSLAWRQALEFAPAGIPGVDLRPFAVAAGRRESDAAEPAADFGWAAAGARVALAAERSWGSGRAYHRFGFDLRYARVLQAGGGLPLSHTGLPVGPDLLRAALPQTLRLGDVLLFGNAWIEVAAFDAWDAGSALLGTELEVQGGPAAIEARGTLDGDARPVAVDVEARVRLGEPVELAAHYVRLAAERGAAATFLPWEERLLVSGDPVGRVLHGIGADLAVRFLSGRLTVSAGAEADIDAPALAALRLSLSWSDPASCLGIDVAASMWLDEPVPNVALALRL
jgi:hypothetical protein